MTTVRYTWMFRVAAAVYLLLGFSWLWTFGFTQYRPPYRPLGLALGLLAVTVGLFLID